MATINRTIGTTGRDYSTFTLWEADDGGGDGLGNDDCTGSAYNDSIFDETYTIDFSALSIGQTVASGERHDGTAGSGARLILSTLGNHIVVNNDNRSVDISWLEVSSSFTGTVGSTQSRGIRYGQDDQGIISNCIIHGILGSTNTGRQGRGIDLFGTRSVTNVLNCIIYGNGGGTSDAAGGTGIFITIDDTSVFYNNTVFNNVDVGAFGGIGISGAGEIFKNNVSMDNSNNDFDGTSTASSDFNLSSDTTAFDNGNSLISKTAANQFVSTSPVNLHLKTGADAIDAGTDLVTTPPGVEIDIDGRDRDAEGDTWDMGADEFVSVVSGGILVRSGMSGGMQIMAGGVQG